MGSGPAEPASPSALSTPVAPSDESGITFGAPSEQDTLRLSDFQDRDDESEDVKSRRDERSGSLPSEASLELAKDASGVVSLRQRGTGAATGVGLEGPCPSRCATEAQTIADIQKKATELLNFLSSSGFTQKLVRATDGDGDGYLGVDGALAVASRLWAEVRKAYPEAARCVPKRVDATRLAGAFARADHNGSRAMTHQDCASFAARFVTAHLDHEFEDSDADDRAPTRGAARPVVGTVRAATRAAAAGGGIVMSTVQAVRSRKWTGAVFPPDRTPENNGATNADAVTSDTPASDASASGAPSSFRRLGAPLAPFRLTAHDGKKDSSEIRPELEWVYGFNAFCGRRSVLVGPGSGSIVYAIGRYVVRYDEGSQSQLHYAGHRGDVTCIAQAGAELVASGGDAVKGAAAIHVIDARTMSAVVTIPGAAEGPLVALAFSKGSKLLASLSGRRANPGGAIPPCLTVWQWRRRERLCAVDLAGVETVVDMRWSTAAAAPNRLVTVGKQHASVWSYEGTRLRHAPMRPDPARGYPRTSFTAAAFLPSGVAALGCQGAGDVYVVDERGRCVARSSPHSGSIFAMQVASGVDEAEYRLVTGSRDRTVCVSAVWADDVKVSTLFRIQFSHTVRAIACVPSEGKDQRPGLVVATAASDVFRVDGLAEGAADVGQRPILCGHFDGELVGLDVDRSPGSRGRYFVTSGEDNQVILWDAQEKRALSRACFRRAERAGVRRVKRRRAGGRASSLVAPLASRAVAVSPDGKAVAVGTNSGSIHVFSTKGGRLKRLCSRNLVPAILKRRATGLASTPRGAPVTTMCFSPDSQALAVGTADACVLLCDATRGYAPRGYLRIPRGAVSAMDWSTNGKHLRCSDTDCNLTFHDVNKAALAQSRVNQYPRMVRNVAWSTQTCVFSYETAALAADADPPKTAPPAVTCLDGFPARNLRAVGNVVGGVAVLNRGAAPGRAVARAHAGPIAAVRFARNAMCVLAAGGRDRAVTQWRLVGPPREVNTTLDKVKAPGAALVLDGAGQTKGTGQSFSLLEY